MNFGVCRSRAEMSKVQESTLPAFHTVSSPLGLLIKSVVFDSVFRWSVAFLLEKSGCCLPEESMAMILRDAHHKFVVDNWLRFLPKGTIWLD